jgi:hypothetical protein
MHGRSNIAHQLEDLDLYYSSGLITRLKAPSDRVVGASILRRATEMILRRLAVLMFVLVPIYSSAQAQSDLSGSWTCKGNCQMPDGQCWIEQNGDSLRYENEMGQFSRGEFVSRSEVSGWGTIGLISSRGNVIDWRNGTRWVR